MGWWESLYVEPDASGYSHNLICRVWRLQCHRSVPGLMFRIACPLQGSSNQIVPIHLDIASPSAHHHAWAWHMISHRALSFDKRLT